MRRKLFCAPSPPPRRPAGRGAPSVTAPALPQKSWRGPKPAEAGGTAEGLGSAEAGSPEGLGSAEARARAILILFPTAPHARGTPKYAKGRHHGTLRRTWQAPCSALQAMHNGVRR